MGCGLYIRCALSIHQNECRKGLGCALYIGARYLPENTVILKFEGSFRKKLRFSVPYYLEHTCCLAFQIRMFLLA
jgi:hypothetical protein